LCFSYQGVTCIVTLMSPDGRWMPTFKQPGQPGLTDAPKATLVF
jgi:hypothetical protein